MPIYEYRCKECHQIFEEWVRHAGDDAPHQCPICDGKADRIMSNTSFVLNGEGWYVTDYGYKSKDKTGASASGQSKAKPAAPAGPASEASQTQAAGQAPASSAAASAGQ